MAAALLSLFGAYLPSSSSSSTSTKATSAAQQDPGPDRGSAPERDAQVPQQGSQSQPQLRQQQYQTELLPFARDASGTSSPADPGGKLLSPALSNISAATNSPYPAPSTSQVDGAHAALHYLDPADDATSKSGYLQAGTSPALTSSLSESVPRNANRALDLYPGYSTDDEERDVLTGDLPGKPLPAPMAPPSAEGGSLGSSDLHEHSQEHIYQRAVQREDRHRSSVKLGHAKPSKKYSARAISFKSRPETTAAILNALRRGQAAQDGVFNERARSHIRALVRALLVERGIPTRVWEKVLLELSIKAAETVAPNVHEGDSCDIGRYVKIKKIPGGLPQDSEYIDGLVFTKNVAHKSMQKDVALPRIVVVDFCLEYQREDELSSLENLTHHREYIHALCTKVLAYRPSVVICGRHVSGIALEVFVKAGVVVVSRVKAHLLSSISRFTSAEIIQSVEELTPDRQVGFCGSFKVKAFHNELIPGLRKSFLHFEGCVKEVGCSLVIRGGDIDLLDAIKFVVAFGVFAAYNLRLEASLMKDELATPTTDYESSRLSQLLLGAEEPATETWQSKISKAVDIFKEIPLSISPYVHFPPPYLLECLRGVPEIPEVFKSILEAPSTTIESNAVDICYILRDTEPGRPGGSRLHPDLDMSMELRSSFQYLNNLSQLSPLVYQNLKFLFSNINLDTNLPCHPPDIRFIKFYRENDITLGQYLEALCANAFLNCQGKNCNAPMIKHFKSYAHSHGRINIIMEKFRSSTATGDKPIMWSYCAKCDLQTPEIPMSDATWNYSFGKYLEVTFYSEKMTCAALPGCDHDVHREHIRYFELRNFTIHFEYDMIDLLEVHVPPMRLRANVDVSIRLKRAEYESIRDLITRFYDSVLSRVANFTYEIVPENKIVACSEVMTDLAKKAGAEKKHLLYNLHQTLVNTPATDMLALNSIIRALQEKTVVWEAHFTGVIRKFIQFDIRSTLPLRGLFQDRANSTMVNDTLTDRMAVIEPDSFSPELVVLGSSPTRPSLLLDEFEEYSTPRISEAEHAHKLRPFLLKDTEVSLGAKGVACLHFDDHCDAHDNHAVIGEDEPLPDIGLADPARADAIPVPAVEILGTETDPLEYRESSGRTPPHAWRVIIETSADGDEDEAVLGSERNHITGVCSGDEVIPVGSFGWSAMTTGRQISGRIAGAGEPISLMRAFSSLWSGNPGNLLPLENPILPTEHIFKDSLVIVREDEPSSIIAFTLSSSYYKERLQSMQTPPASGAVEREIKSGGGDDLFGLEKQANQGDLAPPTPAPPLLVNGETEEQNHIMYQFSDGLTRLECSAFYAEQFDALRRTCGFDEIYIHSLARCFRWDASGGRSGSAFMKTTDDRLILKQLSKPEMEALLTFAPSYFTYVSEAFVQKLPTVLAKIFGVYRIGFRNPVTSRSLNIDVLVMESLFYERTISRTFDLKGSTRNRHVQSTGRQNEVLLDENLVEYLGKSPLFIRDHSKRLLSESIWNDTLFLFKLNVMDYSLIVGIDEEKRELVVGIVDFIRTFTWDKYLESRVRGTTIISPDQYKDRFRESMERYFLSPPTCFTLSPPPAPWTPPGKLPDELQD
ncbi:1-phosphatidylinositol-3-phosphate 5-kinase [Cladochytrium tenue]|nr:1-phosphatidylinositol-3-phosphate 5-kinase [Cladochytrium tenue]